MYFCAWPERSLHHDKIWGTYRTKSFNLFQKSSLCSLFTLNAGHHTLLISALLTEHLCWRHTRKYAGIRISYCAGRCRYAGKFTFTQWYSMIYLDHSFFYSTNDYCTRQRTKNRLWHFYNANETMANYPILFYCLYSHYFSYIATHFRRWNLWLFSRRKSISQYLEFIWTLWHYAPRIDFCNITLYANHASFFNCFSKQRIFRHSICCCRFPDWCLYSPFTIFYWNPNLVQYFPWKWHYHSLPQYPNAWRIKWNRSYHRWYQPRRIYKQHRGYILFSDEFIWTFFGL